MKILLIDDSKAARMITKRALRQAGYGGHEIIEAGNGQEAIGMIKEEEPDLVLCDWNMPVMTGIELLEMLQSEGIDVKFGFLTSEGTEDVEERAREAGALFFVSKPITADKLETALESVMEG